MYLFLIKIYHQILKIKIHSKLEIYRKFTVIFWRFIVSLRLFSGEHKCSPENTILNCVIYIGIVLIFLRCVHATTYIWHISAFYFFYKLYFNI